MYVYRDLQRNYWFGNTGSAVSMSRLTCLPNNKIMHILENISVSIFHSCETIPKCRSQAELSGSGIDQHQTIQYSAKRFSLLYRIFWPSWMKYYTYVNILDHNIGYNISQLHIHRYHTYQPKMPTLGMTCATCLQPVSHRVNK